jgi:hypothetical protein
VQGRRRWRPVVAQWSFPSLQRLPLRSVRVLEWGYSGGGEPRQLSPWPPLPLILLRDRGPTSLLTGWASPIRTRVKGPIGGEINPTFSPLISPYTFNCFYHSITYQCIEHVLSSRSISFLSISDRFNSYNTHLCTETNSLDLGPL